MESGGHTAAADLLFLYAYTQVWFASERDYKVRRPLLCLPPVDWQAADLNAHGRMSFHHCIMRPFPFRSQLGANATFPMRPKKGKSCAWYGRGVNQPGDVQGFTSPPVQLNLGDLTLKRSGGAVVPPSRRLPGIDTAASNPLAGAPVALPPPQVASSAIAAEAGSGIAAPPADVDDAAAEPGSAAVPVLVEDAGAAGKAAGKQGKTLMGMAKKYGAGFVWGQLNGWYKQTVFDPTASLSAERRGTISMPDIESCYGSSRNRYTMKVHAARIHSHIRTTKVDSMCFCFLSLRTCLR